MKVIPNLKSPFFKGTEYLKGLHLLINQISYRENQMLLNKTIQRKFHRRIQFKNAPIIRKRRKEFGGQEPKMHLR